MRVGSLPGQVLVSTEKLSLWGSSFVLFFCAVVPLQMPQVCPRLFTGAVLPTACAPAVVRGPARGGRRCGAVFSLQGRWGSDEGEKQSPEP